MAGVDKIEPGWVTATQFADEIGVTRQRVNTVINGGKVFTGRSLKRVGRLYYLHVDLAKKDWEAAKDLTKAPMSVIDKMEDDEGAFYSLKVELAREKHWKANLAEMEYRVRAGELIPAEEVQEKYTAAVTAARTKLLGISRRVQQRMPHLLTADIKLIHDLVREALEDLAYGRNRNDEP